MHFDHLHLPVFIHLLIWRLPQWAECEKEGLLLTPLALLWLWWSVAAAVCEEELLCGPALAWSVSLPWLVSPLALSILSHLLPLDWLALLSLWSSLRMNFSYSNKVRVSFHYWKKETVLFYSLPFALTSRSVSEDYLLVYKTHVPRLGAKWVGRPGSLEGQWQTWVCKVFPGFLSAPSHPKAIFFWNFLSLVVWKTGFGLNMLILWDFLYCVIPWSGFFWSLSWSLICPCFT